jgi:hypothetical protein
VGCSKPRHGRSRLFPARSPGIAVAIIAAGAQLVPSSAITSANRHDRSVMVLGHCIANASCTVVTRTIRQLARNAKTSAIEGAFLLGRRHLSVLGRGAGLTRVTEWPVLMSPGAVTLALVVSDSRPGLRLVSRVSGRARHPIDALR